MNENKIEYFQEKMNGVRKAEMGLIKARSEYDKEFTDWLKGEGLPDSIALIDIIAHFAPKVPKLIA